MAQRIDNHRTVKAHDPGLVLPEEDVDNDVEVNEQDDALHKRLLDWFDQERQFQGESRMQRAIDHDFVDGDQWSDEDRYVIEEERAQPCLTFNMIGPVIRWITGTEKRTRIDFKILPRKKEGAGDAEVKTKLMKYVDDVNKAGFHRSLAFADAAISGLGWVEDGVGQDPSEEPLFTRYQDWRYVWHDHLSTDPTMRDSRYLFRGKWLDLDVAITLFPDHENQLKTEADALSRLDGLDDNDIYDGYLYPDRSTGSLRSKSVTMTDESGNIENRRERVFVIECWHREPESVQVIRGEGGTNGAIYQESNPVHKWESENEHVELFGCVKMVMHHALFTRKTMLHSGLLPYQHNKFPLTPTWGYRKKRTGEPYGAVRDQRDPQEDLNKRRSKAMHILNTERVVMDKGAVDDKNELLDELGRPDGVIEKKKGYDLRLETNRALAQQHVALMQQDEDYINKGTGVTDENLGRQTNATSGKAIGLRQDQGVTQTMDLFDNKRLAEQLSGEIRLANIEQYYDQGKVVRITGESGRSEFVEINQETDDGILNDVTANQADFIVSEQSYRDTVRQAMFETMMDLVTKLGQVDPRIALSLLDLVVEMSDVPMRDAFVSRIRQINGQRDPGEEPDPEEVAAEKQKLEIEMALEQRTREANVQLLEGKAKEAKSKGNLAMIKAIREKLASMGEALNIGQVLAVAPELGQTADFLMEDAANIPEETSA